MVFPINISKYLFLEQRKAVEKDFDNEIERDSENRRSFKAKKESRRKVDEK